jgi:hypothetical protein
VTAVANERTPEHLAALLRERVYGGISCLSTLLVLTNHLDEDTTPWLALLDVFVAAASLWAASLLADLVSGLATHGGLRRAEVRRSARASAQIMEASAAPLVLLLLAGLGVLGLPAALQAGIWVSVVTLGLFALLAARRTGLVWWKQAVIVAALVGLGALVTVVKIVAHG